MIASLCNVESAIHNMLDKLPKRYISEWITTSITFNGKPTGDYGGTLITTHDYLTIIPLQQTIPEVSI